MDNNSPQKTFWSLINESQIEIPTIQRDYAYSRKQSESIRGKLIKAMVSAINNSPARSPLFLDFVYGKLQGVDNVEQFEKNKQSIGTLLASIRSYADKMQVDVHYEINSLHADRAEMVTFTPLDGQQRLTTLFLLHWFLAYSLKNGEALAKLSRFSYSTRSSSKEFLKMICSEDFVIYEEGSISERIENHERFFKQWKNDPTVRAMLVVLDEIEAEVSNQNIDHQRAWEKLVSQERITFNFFDLDDFELSDELYVKMNARGKELTPFENFKAWLLKSCFQEIDLTIGKKIDIEWSDMFWKLRENKEIGIDTEYLQFFKNMFLGDYLKSFMGDENTKEFADNPNPSFIDILRIQRQTNPVTVFESSNLFTEKLYDYFKVLDFLNSWENHVFINPQFKSESISSFLLIKNKDLTWTEQSLQYALTRFIINNFQNIAYFKEWVRVISNLIYNTPIESPILYTQACLSIDKLLDEIKDNSIYQVLNSLGVKEIDFFDTDQVKEEFRKIELIQTDLESDWLSTFEKLEQNRMFYGQIGFLFNEGIENHFTYSVFEKYASRANELFSETVLSDKTNLLFRVWLVYGSGFWKTGNDLRFPSNIRGTLRNRNENWRRVISNHPQTLIYMLEDDALFNGAIKANLEKAIQNVSGEDQWTNLIIKNPNLLLYSKQHYIREYRKGTYLLHSSRIFGYFVETTTYDWYLRNLEKGISYNYGKGLESISATGLKLPNDTIVYLDSKTGEYSFTNYSTQYKSIDEAIESIKY